MNFVQIDHPVFADAPSTVLTHYPHQNVGQSLHDFWNVVDVYLKLPPPEVSHFDISEMPYGQIDNAVISGDHQKHSKNHEVTVQPFGVDNG
jgi:hypothetical protein